MGVINAKFLNWSASINRDNFITVYIMWMHVIRVAHVCNYRVHKTTDLLGFRLVANEDVASETSSQPFAYICNTNTLQKHYKVQALWRHRLYMKFICMIITILDTEASLKTHTFSIPYKYNPVKANTELTYDDV